MACSLLREAGGHVAVTLIERSGAIGPGVAYAARSPDHLLNVRAANMGAFADEPDHFWRWVLEDSGRRSMCESASDFAPRRLYGRYLQDLIAPHIGSARLTIIQDECVALTEDGGSAHAVTANGRHLVGSAAVLATGNDVYGGYEDSDFENPMTANHPAGLRDDSAILILGSGLTMIDYVQSLSDAGFNGQIIAMSRRGLLPRSHDQVSPVSIAEADIPFGRSLASLTRWLRARIRKEAETGMNWRAVIDALRPHTQKIWRSLPDRERRQFLAHARAWWDVHRHRVAPEVAGFVSCMVDAGRLSVVAARLSHVARVEGGYEAAFRRRGAADDERAFFQSVVDCRGIISDPSKSTNPVIQSMLRSGATAIDPLRIGIRVSPNCALINDRGAASKRIFALGPLTRAEFWESVAIPDIRLQAASLTAQIRRVAG